MAKSPNSIKKSVLNRVMWLYLLMLVLGLILIIRLVGIQRFSPVTAQHTEQMMSRIKQSRQLHARRGNIMLRDGEHLATTVMRFQVNIDYSSQGMMLEKNHDKFYTEADSLSKLLGRFFAPDGRNAPHFRNMMYSEFEQAKKTPNAKRHRMAKLFPRRVSLDEWQTLRQYPLLNRSLGVVYKLDTIHERVYPMGQLARRSIGRKAEEQRHSYGVEWVYDSLLRGSDGRVRTQRIATNFQSTVEDTMNRRPIDGADVVLTLDRRIQEIAERELRAVLEYERALWGTAIVMEVETGEILAMANLVETRNGTYTANDDCALNRRMCPGSTFKLAAMLALLEDSGKDINLTYDTGNGSKVIDGRSYSDSHACHTINLKQAVAESSNLYFIQAIRDHYKSNPKKYTDFLRHLHLDRAMGLQEFGELRPTFRDPETYKNWNYDLALNNMAYGYTIELTPIQTLALYNAVANNGRMMAPMLIKEIRQGGRVLERRKPTVLVDKICSNKNLKIVQECLEEVALTGTAKAYFGRDTTLYSVAAKTGTAQIFGSPDPLTGKIKQRGEYYLGSMVAYFPASNPKYTIMVAVETKRGKSLHYYGATVAGPVARNVIASLYNLELDWHSKVVADSITHKPTSVKGGHIPYVRKVSSKFGLSDQTDSRKGWGQTNVSGSTVTISAIEQGKSEMPNVIGMGLKDALYILESHGLKVSFSGKGQVMEQSVAKGAPIKRGDVVTIRLGY